MTDIDFLSNLGQFLLEWEMFRKQFIEKNQNTHSILNNFLFRRKSCCLCDNVEKYYTAGQATDGRMAYAHCILDT